MVKGRRCQEEYFACFDYPRAWADEYRRENSVGQWLRDFPKEMGHVVPRSNEAKVLKCFCQYALQYRLCECRIQSVTWLYLAHISDEARQRLVAGKPWAPAGSKGKRQAKTESAWEIMREHMGHRLFNELQAKIVVRGEFKGYAGEPDLFCYGNNGAWFFAEAKSRSDRLGDKQKRWFAIAKDVLGPARQVRVYRMIER